MQKNFQYERSLMQKGFHHIAGLDEAGRGALAGPVVAGCVLVSHGSMQNISPRLRNRIKDSKLLSAKQREKAYEFLQQYFPTAAGFISHRRIDQSGITKAVQDAMNQAIEQLENAPDFILTDGGTFRFPGNYRVIIDGDNLVFCIAAASIIAKVSRDRHLLKKDSDFGAYGFAQHKGYATRQHLEAIKRFGPCAFHRKSFSPIKNMVK